MSKHVNTTAPTKIKMELVWHNCKTCTPKEVYNECLYVWNGERVVQAEWFHGSWHHYEDEFYDAFMIPSEDAEHMWWADLHQTTNGFFNKEGSK